VSSGADPDKKCILRLVDEAFLMFHDFPPRIRQLRLVAVNHAILTAYIAGLRKDLTFDESHAAVDREWTHVSPTTRIKHVRLTFPDNYVGAIRDYVIFEDTFTDAGATFVSRSIEPIDQCFFSMGLSATNHCLFSMGWSATNHI
jgi:hypothetical protein